MEERQKRCFISVPMNGRTDSEILKQIKQAKKNLEVLGWEGVDSLITNEAEGEFVNKRLYYLGQSIQLLGTCDCIYFCKGYENASGCRVEHMVAEEYGILKAYERGDGSTITLQLDGLDKGVKYGN